MNADREQLELLISRGAEAPLSDSERTTVQQAIATDALLARDRDAYARLNVLLSDARVLPASVDVSAAAEATKLAIRNEFAEATLEDGDTDALLREMLSDLPSTDWQAFHQRVSAAVASEAEAQQPETIRFPAVLTWAAPLAAAAMLVFAFWGPATSVVENDANTVVAVADRAPIVVVEVERPTSGGLVEISFDRTPPEALAVQDDEPLPGGTVIVNGTWPSNLPKTPARSGGVAIDAYYY